jgi:hypothetical protein
MLYVPFLSFFGPAPPALLAMQSQTARGRFPKIRMRAAHIFACLDFAGKVNIVRSAEACSSSQGYGARYWLTAYRIWSNAKELSPACRMRRRAGAARAGIAYDTRQRSNRMGSPPPATTNEQKILAALVRIESKLDDTERRVKAVQQDVNRVKRIVRG